MGSSMNCGVDICLAWSSMGCSGTTCSITVISTSCGWISALAPGAPPPLLSSLILVFILLIFTLFFLLSCLCSILLFLECVFPEEQPTRLRGLAVSCSHRGHTCSPLLPKPCHLHPIHHVTSQYYSIILFIASAYLCIMLFWRGQAAKQHRGWLYGHVVLASPQHTAQAQGDTRGTSAMGFHIVSAADGGSVFSGGYSDYMIHLQELKHTEATL